MILRLCQIADAHVWGLFNTSTWSIRDLQECEACGRDCYVRQSWQDCCHGCGPFSWLSSSSSSHPQASRRHHHVTVTSIISSKTNDGIVAVGIRWKTC